MCGGEERKKNKKQEEEERKCRVKGRGKNKEKTTRNRVRFLLLFISGLEERERVALLGQSGSRQSKQKYGFEARRKATRH